MILELPTSTDSARYTFEIELDGRDFHFDFEWNDRDAGWFFAIRDRVGDVLLTGIRVVVGFPLINRHRDPRLPPGILDAVDTSGTDTDPGFADLGDRVKLLYTEAASIPASLTIPV